MLRILNMQMPGIYTPDTPASKLFDEDACVIFEVEAPILWWAEFSGDRILTTVSTQVNGKIFLQYQDIIEICEDYIAGCYKKSVFGVEREWADFCETLLDIKGVRDLIQEEL